MFVIAEINPLLLTLAMTVALSAACAMLSVIVVLRRWAFIGEGISHSSFGGAGTAWLLMLLIPALDQPWMPYAGAILFALATAVAIGLFSRDNAVSIDAVIGIFLVASLAWGFLAEHVYLQVRGREPAMFENLLFGQIVSLTPQYTLAAVAVCLAIVVVLVAFWKEIIAWAFDPLLARTAGVNSNVIHYLLITLVTLSIIIGARLVGTVLVTALLVLPAATALLMSREMKNVLLISLCVATSGAVGGILLSFAWPSVPRGPSIVLIMFLQFLGAWIWRRLLARLFQQPRWGTGG
jgi:ABC-type Mn2+/Zn2+ transport system permease subunit